jgi:hypothetical protein
MRAQLEEEADQEWLNRPPIQFSLCLDSPTRNDYNNSSSSEFGNGDNKKEVGTDDYLRDTTAMETMLLDAFQNNELEDDAHINDTIFEILKFASTTPLFGPGAWSKSTRLGTTMLLYNMKAKFGMPNACFSAILR